MSAEILANIILIKYEEKMKMQDTNKLKYSLELATIDEMPVSAFLELYDGFKIIKFHVNSNTIFDHTKNSDYENITYYKKIMLIDNSEDNNTAKDIKYTVEEIIKVINDVRELLPQLKFNVTVGEFVTDDNPIKEFLALQELFICENVTLVYDACSICHEITKTKTQCKHPLCYKCWEKLPIVDSVIIKCPICRMIINQTGDDDDAYSDDSDDESEN